MAAAATFTVNGYELASDRRYDPDTNLWIAEHGEGRVRVGFDPLGAETTGDIVAISFVASGTRLARGTTFATIEAAKFVGPLAAPTGGTLVDANDDVVAAPGSINADPFNAWLVELTDVDRTDLERLLCGEQAVASWFASAVERFRRQGAIAE
jgi:glycine cleavage system H protein